LQHAMGDVQRRHPAAARRQRQGDVAGAARQIERAPTRARIREIDRERFPALVLPERQQPRDQIVTARDGVEQPPHVNRLGILRRERSAEAAHAAVSYSRPAIESAAMQKRLVAVARAIALWALACAPAAAQTPQSPPDSTEWKITDNSFLV